MLLFCNLENTNISFFIFALRSSNSSSIEKTANSTFFITSDDAKDRIRFKKGKLKKNNSFVLLSDGAFDCVFDKSSLVFTNVLYQFIDWTKNEKELNVSAAILKNIKEFFTKKTFDDISLCIIDFTKSKS